MTHLNRLFAGPARPVFASLRSMIAALILVVISLTAIRAQVAYNFQSPDQILSSTGCNGTDLKMDCLAANGYGQWTTSSNTSKSHLLSNKLTISAADDAQSGILSAKSFTFATGDSYPTIDAVRAATNLNGNVRYVWVNNGTTRNKIYVE